MSLLISLLSNHFLIKSSRNSLFQIKTNLRWWHLMPSTWLFGTYCKCVKSLSSGAQFLKFCQSLYLNSSYVCTGSECPGEATHTSLWASVGQKFNWCQNHNHESLCISLHNNHSFYHSLVKSCGNFLILVRIKGWWHLIKDDSKCPKLMFYWPVSLNLRPCKFK